MRLLITGGCGFIGSNFIRYYLNTHKNDEIINIDKLTYCGNPENLRDIEHDLRYHFVKGDICDKTVIDKEMKDIDAVIHFAAESFVDKSIVNADDFIMTNVYGTYVLLEAAKKYNVKKFVMISTDEVYGHVLKGSFNEIDPIKPRNPYSASKAAADLLAQSYFVTHNLPVIVTRSSNNFGPYQYPEKIIPLFVTNLLEGRKVPLYGDGQNIRDWLYVIDNCEAIDFVLRNGKPGEVYNIGGGYEITNLELTNQLLSLLGKDKSFIQHVADRPGHDRRYSLDSSKIHALGWKPRFKFGDALKETVEWYMENTDWWDKLK